ncbi:MAG: preprotein translocase subunit SecA [Bacteroidales bacterium]|nr:preprotein translocase subunit SecA [Bacteroidales bacterium]
MSVINKILGKFIGNKSDRDIKSISPIVDEIKKEYAKISQLSNDDLRAKTIELKQQIQDFIKDENNEIQRLKDSIVEQKLDIDAREDVYKSIDKIEESIDEKIEDILNQILPTAFSIVKETAKRFAENDYIEVTANEFDRNLAATRSSVEINGDKAKYHSSWFAGGTEIRWDMIHYDVQLIGGIVLHQGKISEMATGEGKTLVATLPVFLNALPGRGVHLVTVNDYLAKRDAEWMGPLFEFHGLSVDCIDKHQPNSDPRRKAYNADITYGTNNEFGFDYLRDNMALSPEDLVQRKHNYAIVDEVDSVLIDDARTPLIISGPTPKGDHHEFDELKPRIERLVKFQRDLTSQILIDAKRLIKEGNEKEGGKLLLRTYKGLPKNKALIKFLSEEGMKALLLKTENFYMQNNNKDMPIITDELYFVIDEKNNQIELTDKGIDLITDSGEDPEFFVLPNIGEKIADIEKQISDPKEKLTAKDALLSDYSVKTERVHTVNQLLKAYTLFEKEVEYVVIDNKVKIVDEQTGRIMEGRRYSDGLHQAIEAKENVKIEAATQTYATVTLQNYFRMYHKLSGMTGTAETEAGELWDIYKLDVVVIPTNRPISRNDWEDFIYKTKREKYNAVIDDIVKLIEKGRPVLVGTTTVEISELLSRMLKLRGIKHNVLNAKLHSREADIVAEAGKTGAVTIATNMAGRGTDIKLSSDVKKAGGLAIIGTERHESRRVDRQLRGRSGRQGDPGSSQFYVSLEDDLMRLFGSDRIAKMMDRLGLKEGEVIQHSMITKSIERAQKKVEENNFGIRKRLLEYDDVMNAQREVIYKKRKHALLGERIGVDIANMLYDVCENLVHEHHGHSEFEEFEIELIRVLSVEPPVDEAEYKAIGTEKLVDKVYDETIEIYKRKTKAIAEQAWPVIKDVFENQPGYENIVVPISDGNRVFQVNTNMQKAYDTEGEEVITSFQKIIMLATIDDIWKEHLREMDDLKQSVQNASYEQKDPLLIYKFESFELFKKVVDRLNKEVIAGLLKAHIFLREAQQVKSNIAPARLDLSRLETGREEKQSDQKDKKAQPVRVEKKVGRNDPCPCGSGKKYKNCHGKVNE